MGEGGSRDAAQLGKDPARPGRPASAPDSGRGTGRPSPNAGPDSRPLPQIPPRRHGGAMQAVHGPARPRRVRQDRPAYRPPSWGRYSAITHHSVKNEIKRQRLVDSARFTLDMIKWLGDDDLKQLIRRIEGEDHAGEYEPILLERFLNRFDIIARFYEDGSIDLSHVRQSYGEILKRFKTDDQIRKYLDQHKNLYKPLNKLCDEI